MESLTRRSSSHFFALLACGALSAIAGCGGPGIVGKWTGTLPMGQQQIPMTIEFKADGTEVQSATIAGHPMLVQSTYVVKDDNITETISSATFDGKAVPQMSASGKTESFTYKLDGDTMTLTNAGKPSITLKRADK